MPTPGRASRRTGTASRFALALLLTILVPVVAAHVQYDRPSIQEKEDDRAVHPKLVGANLTFELLDKGDTVSHYVRHVVDPKRGVVSAEHRPQTSATDEAFVARWTLHRIFEYRDQNVDGAYSPGSDTVLRGWELKGYAWNATAPVSVRIGGVQGQYVRFLGNSTGGPALRIETVAAGRAYVDEGATVRPQDVILFLDATAFPRRLTGNLHAIEGSVEVPQGATLRVHEAENATVALLLETDGRLAILDVGGEGTIDGREQPLRLSVEAPRDGRATFRIDLPLLESSARLVMVSGIEYRKEDLRESPGDSAARAALALVAAALLIGGRARFRPRG